MSSYPPRPPRVNAPTAASYQQDPIESDKSPRIPPPPSNQETISSAQRWLLNRDKKLFDSADYYSTPPEERKALPVLEAKGSAFDLLEQEAARLSRNNSRPSALSFEMFNEIEGGIDDGDESSGDETGLSRQFSSLRRNSVEELLVEESSNETAKHALLDKPALKRWDSGDFYSSPNEYRKMLATQAKDVLRRALDHAEEEHRPRRHRRSSLSTSEYHTPGTTGE